jgi:hypothetical protein
MPKKSGSFSTGVLAMMYNIFMAEKHMLDTSYLFQPRGPGTAYLFRMAMVQRLATTTGLR